MSHRSVVDYIYATPPRARCGCCEQDDDDRPSGEGASRPVVATDFLDIPEAPVVSVTMSGATGLIR